jgi:pyruvate/2-oxoglutarate dehydrogenase complex dihydrolipoamide acyltransferase (E2) component
MATDIVMPQLGESIAEGTIVKWLIPLGGHVQKDQSLLEVETDKVALDIPSPATGSLTEILIQEGETVPVGTLLARLDFHSESGNGETAAQTVQHAGPAAPATHRGLKVPLTTCHPPFGNLSRNIRWTSAASPEPA